MTVYPSSRAQAERTIAATRVALAVASMLVVWLERAEQAAYYSQIAYAALSLYVAGSVVMLAVTWRWRGGTRLPFVTHVIDILAFSVLQYLTLGSSSPFFLYFVFSMFCGAIRWGWQGTLATSGVLMVTYLPLVATIGFGMGPAEVERTRVITRVIYLVMATGMLVYLGRYEARLRSDIERLAHWPTPSGDTGAGALQRVIEHAARILEARRGLVVWEASEEPTVNLAAWSMQGVTVTRYAPADLTPLVPAALEPATFFGTEGWPARSTVLVADMDGLLVKSDHVSIHPRIREMIGDASFASAAFRTGRVSGRVFFTHLGAPTAEAVPLTNVIAREIGSSVDQMHATRQRQELAAREERLRLARDLHDGVLQSLTGIRLEMRAVAQSLQEDEAVRARLFGLERALAIEQRELRYFIGGLRPAVPSPDADSSLAGRLDVLRERLALEWKTPVSIRVSPDSQDCPAPLAQAVPLMVHEAVVNALKHAHPTRVNVNVDSSSDRLRIVVSDDGQGFPFKGRYDHRALDEARAAPRSLFDRVTALGGKISIDSSEAGSRIEIVVSL